MRKKRGMGGGRLHRGSRRAVAALYALAMLLLGFAHQPVAQANPQIDLSAFALPDGSWPDLCRSQEDTPHDDTGGAARGLMTCAACLLVHGGGLLPSPMALPAPIGSWRAAPAVQAARAVPGRAMTAHQARAPPGIARPT